MDNQIDEAVRVLRQGGIVIFPTDTAFGIGCRIDKRESVDRLFEIRKRPIEQAVPVLVDGIGMAKKYLIEPSAPAVRFMERYWPGQVTIISWCDKEKVYGPVRGNGEKIGLRMPDHSVPLSLIRDVGVPLLGPSANFHGQHTPFTEEDLDPELVRLVDFKVSGVCTVGVISTVVDVTENPPRYVRRGYVRIPEAV